MAILIDMERTGEASELESNNIEAPLLEGITKDKERMPESCHSGSILVVLISTSVVVLGSVGFGFSVGFSSPTESGIIEDLGLNLSQYSTFGSLLTIGAMMGAIMSGYIADYIGRKGALRVCSVFCIAGWLAIAFAKDPLPLDIGRLLVGYGVGLTSYTVPVYIAEISPKSLRGVLTTTNQLFITTGTLIVYLLGVLVTWRTLAITGVIFPILLLIGLFLIPESPRWLAKVGREKDFEVALQALRGKDCNVSCEATEIMECINELESLPKTRILDLFQRKYARAVIVGVGLMLLQQFCGINAVIFYASSIFKSAGFSSGHTASITVAIVQVLMTAVGASLMDKSGRRPLLMIAAGGMCISCFIVGLSFYIQGHFDGSSLLLLARILSLIGLLGYIATFSMGMGGIPWVIMSEIFPLNMKRIAGSLVSLTAWFGSWIVTLTFNSLFSWSSTASFFIFCIVCAFTVLFVVKLVPETKGRTLEEIQSSLS